MGMKGVKSVTGKKETRGYAATRVHTRYTPLHVQDGVPPAVGRGVDGHERFRAHERLDVLPVLPSVDGCK